MELSFGPFVLDRPAGRLWRDRDAIELRPKAWEVLCYLVDRPGVLVSSDELFDQVWGGVAVTPQTLMNVIAQLRMALGVNGLDLARQGVEQGQFLVEIGMMGGDDVTGECRQVEVDPRRVAHDGDVGEPAHHVVDVEPCLLAGGAQRSVAMTAVVEPELFEGTGAGRPLEHQLGDARGGIDRHLRFSFRLPSTRRDPQSSRLQA